MLQIQSTIFFFFTIQELGFTNYRQVSAYIVQMFRKAGEAEEVSDQTCADNCSEEVWRMAHSYAYEWQVLRTLYEAVVTTRSVDHCDYIVAV